MFPTLVSWLEWLKGLSPHRGFIPERQLGLAEESILEIFVFG
jgi:hypothetical protein